MFRYDHDYHHDDARVLPDGSAALLFSHSGLRVVSRDGKTLADVKIPDSSEVYSQYYRRDKDVLEVRYRDGLVRSYAAENGLLLSEEQKDAPDGSHEGTYVTEDYVVETPLHGAVTAYRQDGTAIEGLEREGFLYDAIQVKDALITLYLTTDNERYGLLMNGNGEILADLPQLSDVLPDGTLIFDDFRGNLYQSGIYSLDELLSLAKDA